MELKWLMGVTSVLGSGDGFGDVNGEVLGDVKGDKLGEGPSGDVPGAAPKL